MSQLRATTYLPALLALFVVVVWGVNLLAVRLTVAEIPPIFATGLRFCLVAALCLPFVRFPKEHLKDVIALSISLGSGHFGLLFVGLTTMEAGPTGILLQLGVPFSTILAFIVFKDRISLKQGIGMAIAFVGVVVLLWDPAIAEVGTGAALIIACAFFWSVANIQIKRMEDIDPMQITGAMAVFAAPQLLFWSFLFEQDTVTAALSASWIAWGSFLYTVLLSSILAYGIWYYLLRTQPVSQVVPYSLLAPVVTIACAVWLLGEPLTVNRAIGGLIVLAGIAMIVIRPRKRRTRAPLS